MLGTIKKAISTTPLDGAIYLVEKLSEKSGFFITNGHLLYLVCNFENVAHKSLLTDYLHLNTDVEIYSFKNNQKFPSGKYNILEFLPAEKGYDENNLESFIKLCISHTELMEAKSFVKFFFSLSELFQVPKSQEYKNLVGFFGELSFLRFLGNTTSIDLSDCCITLDKKQFTWIIVVKALENSLQDNSFYDKFDVSEVQHVQNHFNTFINNSIVRFEFVTAVLSDFNDFTPKKRNKKTVEFIEEKWGGYTSEFALDKLDSNTQEILVKTILARIIYQSSTINCMKEKNLI